VFCPPALAGAHYFGVAVRRFSESDLKDVLAAAPERDVSIHRERLVAQSLRQCVYLLGLDGLQAVGWVLLQTFQEQLPEWRARFRCAEVEDLYVVRRARGRGVGRELMVAAEDAARREGFGHVGLATAGEHHAAYVPARRLYESLGYIDVASGPWIESWAWINANGERVVDYEVSDSYFLKVLG
jgi:GNAT superfamily N-acetyltransferase